MSFLLAFLLSYGLLLVMGEVVVGVTLGVSIFSTIVSIASLVLVLLLFLAFRRYTNQHPRLWKECACATKTVTLEMGNTTTEQEKNISEKSESCVDSKKLSELIKGFKKMNSSLEMSQWVQGELESMNAVVQVEEEESSLFFVMATFGNLPSRKTILFYTLIESERHEERKEALVCSLAAVDAVLKKSEKLSLNIKFLVEFSENTLPLIENRKNSEFFSNIHSVCALVGLSQNPSLSSGSTGVSHFDVFVFCAKQDLHSGVVGGSVPEAMADLSWLLSQLVDSYEWKRNEERKRISLHGIQGAFDGKGDKTVIPGKVVGKISVEFSAPMTSETVNFELEEVLRKFWITRNSSNRLEFLCTSLVEAVTVNQKTKAFSTAKNTMEKMAPSVAVVDPSPFLPSLPFLSDLANKDVVILNLGARESRKSSLYNIGARELEKFILEMSVY